MTYNFDPERWYDIERRHLDHQRAAGALTEAAYEAALADLNARYEDMLDRLTSVMDYAASQSPPEPIPEK